MKYIIIILIITQFSSCADSNKSEIDSDFNIMEKEVMAELNHTIKPDQEKLLTNKPSSNIKDAMNKINSLSHDESMYDDHDLSECLDHVAMWGAEDIAKATGMNKKDVFINYMFDMFEKPPSASKSKKVGSLHVQSYARIIDHTDNDYLVESPKGIIGWVSGNDVKAISRLKRVNNRPKLCE